jgi:hypothetical protein
MESFSVNDVACCKIEFVFINRIMRLPQKFVSLHRIGLQYFLMVQRCNMHWRNECLSTQVQINVVYKHQFKIYWFTQLQTFEVCVFGF